MEKYYCSRIIFLVIYSFGHVESGFGDAAESLLLHVENVKQKAFFLH